MLSDEHAREMCLRFADMECKLGEIDRARAIYSFCSQICDPRVGLGLGSGRYGWAMGIYTKHLDHPHACTPPQTTGAFWQTWKDFEVRHGNEDTIREMLRIRRSVQATYNTQVNFMASQMLKVSGSATGTGELLNLPFLIMTRPQGAVSSSSQSQSWAPQPELACCTPQCLTWLLGRAAWTT